MFSVEKYFDPRVISINHHYEQYERSSIINTYHRSVLKKCIRISGIRSGMSVLDYGCGRKILREYLPIDIDYIGYDIISKFTDIIDIRGKKYDVIFAIQVLQYIDNKGLNELMSNFLQLGDKIIIMCPTQNILKRYIDALLGLRQNNMIFESSIEEIYQFANKYYSLQSRESVFCFGEISRWEMNT